ncbi:MAG TPA: hypothetical protein VHL11_23285 [Phototrophicaceae bacterium]|nr:hypothetical protein [Phototrophicaceae bacterium]
MSQPPSGRIYVRWWDEAETVIYHQYKPGFKRDEFDLMLKRSYALIGTKSGQIDVIIDYREVRTFPPGMFYDSYRALMMTPANLNRNYVLMPDATPFRLVANTFMRLYDRIPITHKYIFMPGSTPERAYKRVLEDRIRARDSSVPS